MTRVLRSIDDLVAGEIDWILARAGAHRAGAAAPATDARRAVVGLAFFEPSLRTRVGFAAAAARLGATPVEVVAPRSGPQSMPEAVADTLRTLMGYADVLVVRSSGPLVVPPGPRVAVVNGGDGGPAAEHPTQALVDLFALCRLPVALERMTIALCGDLRMRAARSLLRLLSVRRPARLVVVTEPPLTEALRLPDPLAGTAEFRTLDELGDVDVLYVVGIPHGALAEHGRSRLRVTLRHLDRLPGHARVLSPLPVIDEMERAALDHPTVRVFEQSDDGLFVRMAVLEQLLGAGAAAEPVPA